MVSTSASFIQKSFKYDVFLSFRGEDTRKNFVDHLYHALHQKGIITYKDDEKIEKGEKIGDQLIESIEDSRFYIIVFSRNYASSSWCLDELVKIMECQKMTEHTAYPIFYDVEPTEVRKQSGSVGEAFEHVTRKRKGTLEDVNLEKENDVGRWKNALKEAAGLAGMELKNTFNGHEAKFIQQIVQDVSLKLHLINLSIDRKLVGMETRVRNVISSLELDLDDVRMIGIKGIGGGGKTTLARVIFDHISIWFDGKSFVEDVREVSKGSLSGLKDLQKQILSSVLNDQTIFVAGVSDGKSMMKRMMPNRKVLVVLDDVDDIDQLEALAGEPMWFKPGSRIIITTRDEQVLVAQRVNVIHDVTLLSDEEAICLFKEMGWNIVRGLHPLEPSKHNRLWIKEEIEDILVNELGTEVTRSIKLKYTTLHPTTIMRGLRKMRELRFLSVHKGDIVWAVDEVSQYLPDALQSLYWPQYPFRSLPQTFQANKLVNLEMVGSNIFKLWEGGERKVLNKIKFIDLRYSELETFDLSMTPNLEKLNLEGCFNFFKLHIPVECPKLKFLNLIGSKVSNLNLGMIPHLVKLHLDGCSEFVELHLPVECPNLKSIDLSGSKVSKLNLRMIPNLEVLHIEGCKEFVELYLPVECSSLKFLYLCGSKVGKLNLGNTQHLEKLNCEGCNELVELHLPVEFLNLKSIDLSGSKVSNLNLGMSAHLEELNLSGCNEFVELHMPIECPKLKFLNLKGTKVSDLNLMAPNLEKLNLEQCHEFVELHSRVECLNIKSLNLSGSKVRNLNLGITPNLERLNLKGCYDFVELDMPVECPELQFLYLGGSKVSNLNLEMTPHLKVLDLEGCYYLQKIHAPMGCLKYLVYINFNGCSRFKFFVVNKWNNVHGLYDEVRLKLIAESLDRCPLHPDSNLPKFQFNCIYREPLPSSSGNIEKLISFGLCACTNLESFSTSICGLQHLRELTLIGGIPEVPNDLYQLQSLEKLRLSMKEIKHLPDSICMLKCLKSLNLYDCRSLQDIPDSICKMKHLNRLDIQGAGIIRLPYSIFQLKGLRITGSSGQLESCGFTNIISRSGIYFVQL
ncbi:putative TIR domain, P-loop containing nucleoside triphosphate hydrolase [Helianthus annuus]|nr:putative TIR domain, P-loop containing nucleoside triphosphate hydrolase [Helianthus annuus]